MMNGWNGNMPGPGPQNQGYNYDFSQMPQQQRMPNRPMAQSYVDSKPPMADMPPQPDFFGKIIERADDIKYSDVPKDGQPAIFPFKDLSGIIVRSCNQYGTIDEAIFLKQAPAPVEDKPDPFQVLYSKIDSLEEKINALAAPAAKEAVENKSKTTKKGVAADE